VADAPRVRRAREDDVTAGDMYRRVAGSHDRALRIIAADLRRNGLGATWVAELDEMVAGAMVAYPYAEAPAGTRRFVVTILAYTPPWRWPSVLRLLWKGHRRAPSHPADWLYVDALATAPDRRRRGVASALLAHAERTAVNNGLSAVVLDTPDSNEAALALYESAAFRVHEVLPAKPPIPAGVILVKEVAT
jgi:ribosomal protein S18 acetylase RimI-like enzyme